MDKLVIEGGNKLEGEVKISGAKNAALPIFFATLLTDQDCTLTNVPALADISTTNSLLKKMGVSVEFDPKSSTAHVNARTISNFEAPYELVRTMRASILVLGPILARYGKAKVSLPGGCSIGARPVNLHLDALRQLGANIKIEEGYVIADAKKLKGTEITFDKISVGATENTMMAAALAEGTTTLKNSAQEPEITDLANFLNKMGAKVRGAGTSTITIEGVSSLKPATHEIIPDRIEAGTYLIAAAMTNGNISMPNVPENIMKSVVDQLKSCGLPIKTESNSLSLNFPNGRPKSKDVTTEAFPGFPTDMQAQYMALMAVAEGKSTIEETIFENRFMHVAELHRLGAKIEINGNKAIVTGQPSLSGATLMATDLRASACLVLAGLAAKGKTTVRRVYHLDRGYEKMENKLTKLGARILREKE